MTLPNMKFQHHIIIIIIPIFLRCSVQLCVSLKFIPNSRTMTNANMNLQLMLTTRFSTIECHYHMIRKYQQQYIS